ncbi:MAG: hypothetical protein K8T26_06780 [Lentisphaerae bacterium]|nr:hypothetical protein [Lentisphaerota bacterium]
MKKTLPLLLLLAAGCLSNRQSAMNPDSKPQTITRRELNVLASRHGETVAINLKMAHIVEHPDDQAPWVLTDQWQMTSNSTLSPDELSQILSGKGDVDLITLHPIQATVGKWAEVRVENDGTNQQCQSTIHLGGDVVSISHGPGILARVLVFSLEENAVSMRGVVSLFTADANHSPQVLMPFDGTFPLGTNVVVFSTRIQEH